MAGDTQPAGGTRGGKNRTLQLLAAGGRGHRSLADAAAIAANPGVIADIYGATDVGRTRASNQDQFLVAALERALFIEGSSLPAQAGTRLTDTPQGRLLIVADGIGGHGGGELASAITIDAMALYAFETMPWAVGSDERSFEELSQSLRDAVASAQARVRRVARRKNVSPDLGTTLTMAYVTWPDLHLVHVGDSRAYLLREGTLHRLTRDHTLAQMLVDGSAMTPEEAARSHLSHVLVNAVGGGSDELHVELHRVKLEIEDQLLLCTDGLYDMLGDDVIAEHLRRTDREVERVVSGLVDAANEAGGRDNVTVVLARF
ncbi:PP2C family protein-serine/threonine phosphatase [Paraliomyxa miuraensis]|uniref:PP2C family protein-serine/threonine phosphatase n=1 Tax=Paraliomyxa miuraensis TaxID=376150 RepID=UPI002251CEE9|nr:protein phosphatase 2C domain-containing protein [Paraliomyxa miuraensis]MCX4241392.1 protein phosphatase 2C domain-containing protein [Paraliomyxa miuraensis]